MWGCPRGGFGRVESEFGVKNVEKLAPEAKNIEKTNIKKHRKNNKFKQFKTCVLIFFFLLLGFPAMWGCPRGDLDV